MRLPDAPQAWDRAAAAIFARSAWPMALQLGLADLGFGLHSDLRLEFLQVAEMLLPHFEPRCAGAGDWRVVFTADSSLPMPDDGAPQPIARTHGSSPVDGLAWAGGGEAGWLWVRDLRYGALVGICEHARRLLILSQSSTEAHAFGPSASATVACAAIRLIVRSHLARLGGLVLHAAAVAIGSGAFLLLGAKGAGKSTVQLALMARLGAGYVASDRCFVFAAGEGVQVSGWPSRFRVASSSLALVPTALRTASARSPIEKHEFGAVDVALSLGVPLPAVLGLAGLIHVDRSPERDGWTVAEGDASSLVETHRFGLPDPSYANWLWLSDSDQATADLAAAVRQRLQTVPSLVLTGNGSPAGAAEAVRDWCRTYWPAEAV